MRKVLFIVLMLCSISICGKTEPQYAFTVVTGSELNDTLRQPLNDLVGYIKKVIRKSDVKVVERVDEEMPAGNIILFSDERLEGFNAFSISSRDRKDGATGVVYELRGSDIMGCQYAIYDLAERLLGVRYLKPELDHAPEKSYFAPIMINTGIQMPDYKWRGLYPWHYNYNDRGANTFCDVNAHFKAGDWNWFMLLADWMVKNKQNAVLWFDDVFAHQNISGQMPDYVADYYAKRGIHQILGMGWASNEDLQGQSDIKRQYCLNDAGKTVEDAGWKRSICPQSEEYFPLADLNFSRMNLSHPENYLGVLIGYGENTWASREHGVDCVKHKDVKSSTMMLRDLQYVQDKFKSAGMGNLPVGYVTSTHSIRPADSPFKNRDFINQLPKNSIFTMHTYQQSEWRQFASLYDAIAERNSRDSANLKVFHIAEVAFICNADIPLLKPTILRRRSEHYKTLPRENTIGHLATLNTTQYLYWYNTYQEMQWQWQRGDGRWDKENTTTLTGIFGKEKGGKVNEIFNRLACLEQVKPYASLDSLKQAAPSLLPPPEWGRYNPKTHGDDFGFYLWANVSDLAALKGAKQSIARVMALNETLAADELYAKEFYTTTLLSAHYYNIRVQEGLRKYYKQQGKKKLARQAAEAAKESVAAYDRLMLKLHNLEVATKKHIGEFKRDLALNPTKEYFDNTK